MLFQTPDVRGRREGGTIHVVYQLYHIEPAYLSDRTLHVTLCVIKQNNDEIRFLVILAHCKLFHTKTDM